MGMFFLRMASANFLTDSRVIRSTSRTSKVPFLRPSSRHLERADTSSEGRRQPGIAKIDFSNIQKGGGGGVRGGGAIFINHAIMEGSGQRSAFRLSSQIRRNKILSCFVL